MTVGAFAVVRDIDHIDQLADDLGSLTETLRASSKPTVTDGLMGVWVENTPAGVRDLTTPPSLSDGPEAAVGTTVEVGGTWALCVTTPQVSSREALLALLERQAPRGADGLFVPVYRSDADPAQRDLDWGALARRFPGRVLPLMVQEPSGRLTHDAPTSIEHTYRRSMPLAG